MNIDRPNRRLSRRFTLNFIRAIEDEVGGYSLAMLMRNAGLGSRSLQGVSDAGKGTTGSDAARGMLVSEYSALQKAIRDYYGMGSRGTLNRIGHGTWQRMLKEPPAGKGVNLFALRLLPAPARRVKCLEYLAEQMREPNGQVSVHELDTDLIFLDQSGDATYGQTAEKPICWMTQGMIQAALLWAMVPDPDVEEINCISMGADACKFRIRG